MKKECWPIPVTMEDGITYHLYDTRSFSERINRSISSLEKIKKHPAKLHDEGRVLWCLEYWCNKVLRTTPATEGNSRLYPQKSQDYSPFTYKDFEKSGLHSIQGGAS